MWEVTPPGFDNPTTSTPNFTMACEEAVMWVRKSGGRAIVSYQDDDSLARKARMEKEKDGGK